MRYSILIFITLYLCGCQTHEQENTNATAIQESKQITLTKAQRIRAGITTEHAQKKLMGETITMNGVIDVPPQNLVSVSVPTGGYLKSTPLLPGMSVTKGQVIAVIENEVFIEWQQQYLNAGVKFSQLEKEYRRQQELNKSKTTSDKVFEQVTSEFQQQQIEWHAAAQKLKLIGIDINRLSAENISRSISLTAPISGYVSAVHVNIGKYVNPTDVLFELVNPNDLHLALTAYEKDIDRITTGLNVSVWAPEHPDVKYRATTLLTGKKLDDNRSAIIHCHFIGDVGHLLPGMYLNAKVFLPERECWTVPIEALVQQGKQQYVFLAIDSNNFELTPVTTGLEKDGMTEVIASADWARDSVVVKGAYALYMKLANRKEGE